MASGLNLQATNATLNDSTIQLKNVGTTAGTTVVTVPNVTGIMALKEGTTTNDNALTGQVGEHISSTVVQGAPVSLTSNVTASVTSITLTAGDWDVTGRVGFATEGTTNVTKAVGAINTSVITDNDIPSITSLLYPSGVVLNTPAFGRLHLQCGRTRVSVATTTTIYLIALAAFTVATMAASGTISARRVR